METTSFAPETADEMAAFAEFEYAEAMREIEDGDRIREREWLTLRGEIMARGGITAGDVSRHYLPGQVYRVNGLPVDVMARDLADEGFGSWEDGEEFLADLWRMFESYQGEWNRNGRPRFAMAA